MGSLELPRVVQLLFYNPNRLRVYNQIILINQVRSTGGQIAGFNGLFQNQLDVYQFQSNLHNSQFLINRVNSSFCLLS